MESSSIADVFGKHADVGAGVFNGGVDIPLDLLLLERAHKALGLDAEHASGAGASQRV